ncbi:hypothetical protein [Eikenella sp. Marseille-P7795]|uniref:hypothetical protein n=1 Tax=Eikenella sp. Marseille-P7795 TaxID=2866577 RepID=UPI001CE452E9|nr:hypothetical protein [Eikenella sp. Marseille-P7795]
MEILHHGVVLCLAISGSLCSAYLRYCTGWAAACLAAVGKRLPEKVLALPMLCFYAKNFKHGQYCAAAEKYAAARLKKQKMPPDLYH